MKKVFALAFVLALVAILAVPMAATAATTGVTTIGGNVTVASISITPPSALAFGAFVLGANDKASTTAGTVTLTKGTSGAVNWSVTAQATTGTIPGKMSSATNSLTEWLLIGKTLATPTWYTADGAIHTVNGINYTPAATLTYTGITLTGTLPFCGRQYIVAGDATAGADTYAATITFTATCTP